MDGKKVVAKKLLGIPLTQKEQAFYEMFLQGNEKEILKGIAWAIPKKIFIKSLQFLQLYWFLYFLQLTSPYFVSNALQTFLMKKLFCKQSSAKLALCCKYVGKSSRPTVERIAFS